MLCRSLCLSLCRLYLRLYLVLPPPLPLICTSLWHSLSVSFSVSLFLSLQSISTSLSRAFTLSLALAPRSHYRPLLQPDQAWLESWKPDTTTVLFEIHTILVDGYSCLSGHHESRGALVKELADSKE